MHVLTATNVYSAEEYWMEPEVVRIRFDFRLVRSRATMVSETATTRTLSQRHAQQELLYSS